MTRDEIKSIVLSELSLAIGGNDSEIEENRSEALEYYYGNKPARVSNDRSGFVSTDIADAVEWLMPSIMESLVQNNEIVSFDPVREGDEIQAALESEYVYTVLMKDNNGFLSLYSFVKDMLLQKNGIVKAYYEEEQEEKVEAFTGLDSIQLQMLAASPEVEVIELSEAMSEVGPVFDVKVIRRKDNGKIVVLPVPPEEFRVNSNHNSSDISKARFVAHVSNKTVSELIESGYNRDLIESLPAYNDVDDEDRFHAAKEYFSDDTENKSQRLIEVAECYLKLDLEDTGVATLQKVTIGGGKEVLDIEEVDEHPLISATAIIMPHKWAGLSIYDRLKEIQEQKTTLIRNIFDNIYLQNNGRTLAGPGVNLDDLMTNRPGGIVRARDITQVGQLKVASLGPETFGLFEKLTEIASGRSGVSPEGAAQNYLVGAETAHGIERLMTAKEALVNLIVRVIAETGLKPLCVRIRDLLRRHVDAVQEYQFRNEWVQFNPSQWADRSRVSIRVGLGSGDKQKKLNAMSQVLAYQEKILSEPTQTLVREKEVFAALNDYSRMAGLTTVRNYFIDPSSQEGQQRKAESDKAAQQKQMESMQMQMQALEVQKGIAQAELQKAQAQQTSVNVKAQLESVKLQMQNEVNQAQAEIAWLKQQLEKARTAIENSRDLDELKYKYDKLDKDADAKKRDQQLKEREIEVKEAQFLAQRQQESQMMAKINDEYPPN